MASDCEFVHRRATQKTDASDIEEREALTLWSSGEPLQTACGLTVHLQGDIRSGGIMTACRFKEDHELTLL